MPGKVEIYRIRYYIDFISPFNAKIKEEMTIFNPDKKLVVNDFTCSIDHKKTDIHIMDSDNTKLEFIGKTNKGDIIEIYLPRNNPLQPLEYRTIVCEYYISRNKKDTIHKEKLNLIIGDFVYSDFVFGLELDQSSRVYGVTNKRCDYDWNIDYKFYKRDNSGNIDFDKNIEDKSVDVKATHEYLEFLSRNLGSSTKNSPGASYILIAVSFNVPRTLLIWHSVIGLICWFTLIIILPCILCIIMTFNDQLTNIALIIGALIVTGTITVLESSSIVRFDDELLPMAKKLRNRVGLISAEIIFILIIIIMYSVLKLLKILP